MSNRDLARRVAAVADALAEYDHLPALDDIAVYARGGVFLYPAMDFGKPMAGVRTVAGWAAAFDVPVVIDLSSGGNVVVVAPFAGGEAKVQHGVSHQAAYELGRLLGVEVSPGGQVQVSAQQLLDALADPADAEAVSR